MAQLIKNPSRWWLIPGATVRNTIQIRIKCSNMHDANAVQNIWEEHQYQNFYKQNCYGWREPNFCIHEASKVTLINETTVEISGLVGNEFLFKIYLLLHKLKFIEAEIKCKDDRNPRCVDIWHPMKRQAILNDDIVSVYVFKLIGDNIVLF